MIWPQTPFILSSPILSLPLAWLRLTGIASLMHTGMPHSLSQLLVSTTYAPGVGTKCSDCKDEKAQSSLFRSLQSSWGETGCKEITTDDP